MFICYWRAIVRPFSIYPGELSVANHPDWFETSDSEWIVPGTLDDMTIWPRA